MKKNTEGRLQLQIFMSIVGAIGVTVLLFWLACSFFINIFYTSQKKVSMEEAYWAINESCEEGYLYSGEYDRQLERMTNNMGVTVLVAQPNGDVVFSSTRDVRNEINRMYSSIMGPDADSAVILVENEQYMIKRELDSRLNESYMVLWGTLSDGNLVVIRCALESIYASTRIMSRFLIYISIISTIFGAIIAVLFARRITKPIIELKQLSKRMSDLDFNAKYASRKHPNEIDELGETFNVMSNKLEATISELKDDIAKLEAEEKSRKDFVTDVSHELKTPISLIQGYAEGLSEGVMEDEESRNFYLDVIKDEANHMNRLVRQLLDLSHLESSVVESDISEFNLTELISGIIENNKLAIEQAEATVEMPTAPCIINSDEFLIEQVLMNYVSNAIHHVDGERKINIRIIDEEKFTRVTVFNTGNSIPTEDVDHLWDKFYKVDKARTREYGGSGIGLSIVKATMEKLKGRYGVSNHLDGVEFYISIPKYS